MIVFPDTSNPTFSIRVGTKILGTVILIIALIVIIYMSAKKGNAGQTSSTKMKHSSCLDTQARQLPICNDREFKTVELLVLSLLNYIVVPFFILSWSNFLSASPGVQFFAEYSYDCTNCNCALVD